MNELKSTIRANKNYCIYCSEIGHTLNKCNNLCHIKKVMVDYFLDTNVNETDDMNTHFEIISKETDVPVNVIEELCNIFTMVNEGRDITEIYEELDKCQSLCLQCHHIVTDIENKLGFTLVKINLSRKLTTETITIEDYNAEVELYKKIYSKKMNTIYRKNYLKYWKIHLCIDFQMKFYPNLLKNVKTRISFYREKK